MRSEDRRGIRRALAAAGLAALGAAGVAAACRSGPTGGRAGPERLVEEPLATTPHSGVEESERRVIRDATEWRRWWRLLVRGVEPEGGPPAVDFESQMVLLAAMGRRPTGGYAIQVDSVVRRDGGLEVWITETAPGPSCMTTQAFTAPATAVGVPRDDGPIRFRETERTADCR